MSRSSRPSKRPAEAQEAAWIADEDRFVLQQAKKKAAIRVKGGRAQPIDWLTVILAVIDPDRNPLDDEADVEELDVVEPESVFEELDDTQMRELEKGIDSYLGLESSRSNQEYWATMKTICKERQQHIKSAQPSARGVHSVAGDLDKLLGPKSLEDLEKLEKQIKTKLSLNEPIDTDYWEHLLRSLLTYKAKAKLRRLSQSLVDSRLEGLRKQQAAEATALKAHLVARSSMNSPDRVATVGERRERDGQIDERHPLDPEPLLRVQPEDKSLDAVTEADFATSLVQNRQNVLRLRYIPKSKRAADTTSSEPAAKRSRLDGEAAGPGTSSAFDREVARGLHDNEDIFTTEVEVTTKNRDQWAHNYRPRKPKYFNRVVTGYDWNKYNQTHYDHDNPPPKVVQGYRFTVFYPDLVEKNQAPTYKIERESGRKKGQSFAPAGEDDTCVIRFFGGAPYEDIAFRVVDREWDYSAKRERGFKSSFDKGILQLHFQFKKIYYRK